MTTGIILYPTQAGFDRENAARKHRLDDSSRAMIHGGNVTERTAAALAQDQRTNIPARAEYAEQRMVWVHAHGRPLWSEVGFAFGPSDGRVHHGVHARLREHPGRHQLLQLPPHQR